MVYFKALWNPIMVNDQLPGDMYGHMHHNNEYISPWEENENAYLFCLKILSSESKDTWHAGGLQSPIDPILVDDQVPGDLYGHRDDNCEFISAWQDDQHA